MPARRWGCGKGERKIEKGEHVFANLVLIYMNTYHIEALMPKDGSVLLSGLPFKKGEKIDITLRTLKEQDVEELENKLKGSVLFYIDPFEPVGEDDWEVLK
jgi:hypothetical protein